MTDVVDPTILDSLNATSLRPTAAVDFTASSAGVVSQSAAEPVAGAGPADKDVAERTISDADAAAAAAENFNAVSAACAAAASATENVKRLVSTPMDYEQEDCSAFECNICLDLAKEPVVTLCGHLFCWPCLYRWVQVQQVSMACPVCKAGVQVFEVIPIYCRSDEPVVSTKEEPLPPRPVGQRTAPVIQAPPPNMYQQQQQQQMLQMQQMQQQQAPFPFMTGFQNGADQQGYNQYPELQHQAFLSRLLLMLGSFVIMCVLMF